MQKQNSKQAIIALKKHASFKRAKINAWFFKSGIGQYGEGDKFLGVTVPDTRIVAKEFLGLPTIEIQNLLKSDWHEIRLLGLIILTLQFNKLQNAGQEALVRFYINNRKYINNWDMVDLTASKILGAYLYDKDRKLLYQLVRSKNLWERRIAIIATYYFIKKNDFKDTLKLCEILLLDKQDLMHKATGWMLREAGKQDEKVLIGFLKKHSGVMPRTMLRYSIEKLPEKTRQKYLSSRVIPTPFGLELMAERKAGIHTK